MIIHSLGFTHICGEPSNGRDFIELITWIKPDIVIMDIDMPTMDEIEATKRALVRNPELKIIALSMLCDKETQNDLNQIGSTTVN
jgi:two-component system response regulator DegU